MSHVKQSATHEISEVCRASAYC